MENLAPDIVRQRLLIEGFYGIDIGRSAIERYFEELAVRLNLRTYATPTIFSPGEEGRTQNQGYDAFMPLIDSGISLYVWTAQHFLSIVIFTCKTFNIHDALEFTDGFFRMPRSTHQAF
jgi:S-adenosylmethionine decarboxylase